MRKICDNCKLKKHLQLTYDEPFLDDCFKKFYICEACAYKYDAVDLIISVTVDRDDSWYAMRFRDTFDFINEFY
jgi:C4-type Zn-finger protein